MRTFSPFKSVRRRFGYKLNVILAVFCLTTSYGYSQTDVTDTYLTNAGFDASFNYPIGYSGTVGTTAPGTMGDIDGWTAGSAVDWSVAGTFEYGWTGRFNDASVPTEGADGATGPGEGALGISVGWGNSVSYTQALTLPAGTYELEYAIFLQGGSVISRNLIGWLPNFGSGAYSSLTSSTEGEWTTGTLTFKLTNETSGKIRVGMTSNSATSTALARMYVDYVSLTYYSEVDLLRIELEEQLSTAEANAAIYAPGVYNTDELNSAIATAQAIDFENTTVEDVQSAIDALTTANETAAGIMAVYSPLQSALVSAKNYEENTYYPGRTDLQAAIATAEAVYSSTEDQTDNIAATVTTLNEAVDTYLHSGTSDVTDTYLTNAGFNQDIDYLTGGTQTVATTNPGTVNDVTGWTKGTVPSWTAAAIFEFGWNGTFNGVSAPATGADGTSGTGQGALGLTVGWGNSLNYTQDVTLPAGKYTFEYAAYFQGADNIAANLIGWIPASGAEVLSDITTATVGEWTTGTVSFTLSQETSGTFQVGMTSNGVTSASNTRLFIDYVKLLNNLGDKTDLEILTDSATYLLANQENVPAGSDVYTALETKRDAAQVILDDANALESTIISAETEMAEAIEAVHTAILTYNTSDATVENPIDLTYKLVNPDFELNGGSTEGWVTTLGIYSGGNSVYVGAPASNHVLDGTGLESATGYQSVSALPLGVYRVKAVARGRVETSAKMFLGVETGSTFGSSEEVRVSIEVDRIGDSGGELDYGFNPYETPYLVLQGGESQLTLGIYFEGDNGWSSVDAFELYYYGTAANVVIDLKAQITTLKDSTNLPDSYDLTEVNALLATDLTSENANSLVISLENMVKELSDVISQNIDTTLADILIDGVSLRDFSSSVTEYSFNIHTPSSDMPSTPVVTVAETSTYATSAVVDATEIPGTTTITVTAGNGATQEYTINFTAVVLEEYENLTATYESLKDVYYELSGVGKVTITGTEEPLAGSKLDLVSTDEWIYFPNLKPSEVVADQLYYITVNGEEAVNGTNIWVAQYMYGAMVMPHSSTYEALTAYANENLVGESKGFQINTYYKSDELGSMDKNIESFVLRKGYMATFASNEDGTGISRVYIADKNDITIKTMPSGLSNTASFVIVRHWRWTTKKAWRGSEDGAITFNAGSHYDYNNADRSTLDIEYIPMRHNPNWNAYSNFLDKHNSTHALGYNEPDNSVDDGYSPVNDAINAWPNMMASGHRLGTPAVTDGGLSWLYTFLDACEERNYRVDFVAWHFYRAGYTASGLYSALKAIHDRTGRPLWITEWNNGCNWTYSDSNPAPSIERNGEIIDAMTAMMDTCSFVERYFVWDGCNETLRMTNSSTGELYPAGIAYRDQVSTMSFTEDYYNSSNSTGGTIIQENTDGFCSMDGTIDSNHEGYTGIGFVNTTNAKGSSIEWNVVFAEAGAQTLTFRYAMTDTCYANIYINDKLVADSIEFSATTTVAQWEKLPVTLYVDGGIAKIRLEALNEVGLPNIDYLQVTGITAADCDASVHTVTFNVLDGTEAIVGATVDFNGMSYITDATGTVTIDYVNNGGYTVTVKADGFDEFSQGVSVDGADITVPIQIVSSGVDDLKANGLMVYPNPASSVVNIRANVGLSDVRIYNNLGQLVITYSNENNQNQMQIDVSRLGQGVYFLQFTMGNTSYYEKLMLE